MHPEELHNLLHRALESRLERIQQLTARAGWLDDTGAVHDVRVASRRLRAVLELADPERYPAHRKQRKRAKALTEALGVTRELDVKTILLGSLGPELADRTGHAVLEHVLETLNRQRLVARRRMARGVERAQVSGLSGLLEAQPPRLPPESEALNKPLANLLEPRILAALFQAMERVQAENAPALHRLRIEVKKLRYGVEILAPALSSSAAEWIASLKFFQEALGDHHDWTTLEADLWGLHAELTEHRRATLAAGILDLLGLVVEHRRAAFEALPHAAEPMDAGRAMAELFQRQGGVSA
jgi:CHAD domain-containing protein